MAWGRINISAAGGTSYNYKITAYATEGSIPASGNIANDIAVVTSTAIPAIDSGGIIWSATQPTVRSNGHTLVTGDIWIINSYASNAPFVAVNGIYVYGVGCFQYNGSTWGERVAKIYYGGAWVSMYLYLYYLTNQCTSVTGGWQARAWSSDSSTPGFLPTITYGADYVNIAFTSQNQKSGVYEIINDVDLTNFSSLVFDGYGDYNSGYKFPEIAVVARGSTYYSVNADAKSYITNLGRGTTTLNISALNGNYDVCAAVHTYTTQTTFLRMYSIRLIP